MKKKKISTANLVVCVVVLVAFLLILLGAALFERGMNEETVPAETGTGEAVQTTVSASEAPAETMTEAMIETTMPAREPRNINFLFVGRDWHDEGENGRSDTMILCNVDTGRKTVKMVSFLRDIYLKIPGHGSSRLNAAYSWGGADLLIETLDHNFDVPVDVTIEIDFDGFKQLIDILGGVDVNLTDRECSYLQKNYGWEFAEGMCHLDGEQALAYSRIRYLDSDFVRTERQRNVLVSLMEKYRDASHLVLLYVTDALLDNSTSNCTDDELLVLAFELYETLREAELATYRVPADGTYRYETIRGMSVVDIDLEDNRELLKQWLSVVPEA